MTINSTALVLLLKLLTAHMVSDYFLQFNSWPLDKAKNKIKSKKLYLHILITFLVAWIFSGSLLAAAFIGLTHYMIDLAKVYLKFNRFVLFLADQFLHLLMLVIAWLWLINGWGWIYESSLLFFQSPKTWVLLFAYGIITFPLSIVINIFIHRWRSELAEEKQESLERAGFWIGILERILILTFILVGQFSAMGFLIATKAILRFKDSEIKQMEYVLIGTLMSLTPTILIGITGNYFLNLF